MFPVHGKPTASPKMSADGHKPVSRCRRVKSLFDFSGAFALKGATTRLNFKGSFQLLSNHNPVGPDGPGTMRLTIFKRLTLGYLAIMLLVFCSGVFVTLQLNHLNHLTHDAANVDGESIRLAETLSGHLTTLVSIEKKFWISGDIDFQKLFLKRRTEFINELNRLELLLNDNDQTDLLAATRRHSNAYFDLFIQQTRMLPASHDQSYDNRRENITREIAKNLQQIAKTSDVKRDEKIRRTGIIGARVIRATVGFALLCILAGLAVSLFTTRSIVRPIVILQRKTRDIAAGRFETIQGVQAPPEIRELADDFNAMSERLKELDTLKEDFVSHVSHELRTPLTAIREASGMLLEGTVDDAPESRTQLLSIVQAECERLIVSVNRILDLSRMESRMMDYQFGETDVVELSQQAIVKLTPIASKKSISLVFEPSGRIPSVWADQEQVLQLLENLIGNALKFTEPEGSVTIRIYSLPGNHRDVLVAITDSGCGIAPEHLEHIFDKFRRIESRKGTSRGTGLGLSIAKHIVTAHGGRIWVESKTGQGSTFHFTLPACSS